MTDEPARAPGRGGEQWLPDPPVFVGRERELTTVTEALLHPPAVVLVEGEAGIGKSRLLREFLAAPVSGELGLVVRGDCPPLRDPYTLGPVVDAVRQATDEVTELRLSPLAGALRPLFPEWADQLPPAPEPAEDARTARHRLFRALRELFDALDVAVLVVEDVHWADDATLEFLLFMVTSHPQQCSVVLTFRPEDVPGDSLLLRLSSHLPAGTTRARLELDSLDVAQTARLVSSMLGGAQVSPQFAAFVHERTDGVPLAVEESVRLMRDRSDVFRRGEEWVRRHLADIDVPPMVRDAVVERTRRLSQDAQSVLGAIALLDTPSPEAMVAAVSGLPPGRVGPGLSATLECGLVVEDRQGLASFRHGLASRAVYEAIPGPQRRLMHQRAGQALEALSPLPVARLARHFREAGDHTAWARYAEQAADAAAAAGDWGAAADLLHHLLSHAELPPAAVAPLVAKMHTESLTGTSWVGDIVRALREALGSDCLTTRQRALTRYWLGMMLILTDYDECRRELERVIPDLEPGSLEQLQAMVVLGWSLGSACPGQEHRAWLRRAAEAENAGPARPLDEQDTIARRDLVASRAVGLLLLGEPEGWTVAAALPVETGTPAQRRSLTLRDYNLGDMALLWGRYPQARTWLGNAWKLAEEYGYSRYRQFVRTAQVQLDWFTGHWDGLAERAAGLARDQDTHPINRLRALLVTGLLTEADGGFSDAEDTLTGTLAQMRDLGTADALVEPAAALARLYLATGRVKEALAVTEEPIGVVEFKETWLWATALAPARVEALTAADRLDEAAALAAAFTAGVRGRGAPAPQAAVPVCEGIVAVGRGLPAQAAEEFARAATAWDELPRPYDALLARERQAHCLLAAGQRASGLSLLADVSTGLSGLGAGAGLARVANALEWHKSAAGPRGRGRPGYGDRLSPRETEVARLVVAGLTNPQIAEALVMSPRTVSSHVRSAMRKLQVSSRTELAVSVVEYGLPEAVGVLGLTPVVRRSRRHT